MIIGIGTDIIKISRLSGILDRQGDRFVQRILTETEQAEFQRRKRSVVYLASRFAAKEAAAKALGTGIGRGVSFQQLEVSNLETGQPVLTLHGYAAELFKSKGGKVIHISLSDEEDMAVAFVTLSGVSPDG
ncbi:holo-ACP synthase [Endozoicomonadaceae bacterium StTr2]